MMRGQEIYDDLLMRYACGGLDEALGVLVAAHAALDSRARHALSLYESVGGALLESCCDEAQMSAHSLDAVMAKLECETARAKCCGPARPQCHESTAGLPMPLRDYMERGVGRWLPVYPGVAVMPLRAGARRAMLVRARPGAKLPFIHPLTLTLQGALVVDGQSYTPGAMVIREIGTRCKMRADADQGCLCLSVTEERAPVSLILRTVLLQS